MERSRNRLGLPPRLACRSNLRSRLTPRTHGLHGRLDAALERRFEIRSLHDLKQGRVGECGGDTVRKRDRFLIVREQRPGAMKMVPVFRKRTDLSNFRVLRERQYVLLILEQHDRAACGFAGECAMFRLFEVSRLALRVE